MLDAVDSDWIGSQMLIKGQSCVPMRMLCRCRAEILRAPPLLHLCDPIRSDPICIAYCIRVHTHSNPHRVQYMLPGRCRAITSTSREWEGMETKRNETKRDGMEWNGKNARSKRYLQSVSEGGWAGGRGSGVEAARAAAAGALLVARRD